MADLLITPGQLNISLTNGDTLNTPITFESVDLTGYTLESYVFKSVGGPNSRFPITINAVLLASGQVEIELTEAEVAAIGVGKFAWLFKWTDTNSVTRTVLAGNFTILQPK